MMLKSQGLYSNQGLHLLQEGLEVVDRIRL